MLNVAASLTETSSQRFSSRAAGTGAMPSDRSSVEGMRIVIVVLGVVVALFGLLFALQGFGVVSGSPMTNTTTWSILGPIIALIGIAIAFAGWRGRKS
jgi:amino acid transporter